ncbi:hypothetical protein HY798_00235 [Candidatus Falkowbacteria bacterium]|nr:hypothetical protein [Candidatus Falkowbacteria bacterium]
MELQEFIAVINRKKATILLLVILFVMAGVVFTAVQPFKYGAKSKLLVVQSYADVVDPYVASKSNEYLSNVLANVVASDSFFNEVINSGYHVNADYFPARPDKRLKEWTKTADARAVSDTGMIVVNVYHKDKYQAGQIAEAVNYILKTKNSLYHGGGDKVSVKVIDSPVISNWPVKPNIVLNLALATALGIIFSLCYVYLLPEKKYDLKIWPFSAHQKKENSASSSDSMEAAVDKPLVAESFIDEAADKEIKEALRDLKDDGLDLEDEDDLGDNGLSYEDILKQGKINNIL